MQNDMVSIIVPVYNAELYLSNCVNSILNQTYKNIEVILVNDGSTDNSGIICEEFAKKDSRVKTIHQDNSGPSVARNTGINAAVGKYLQFVDSDDYIEANMITQLIEAMEKNVQLVICGYKLISVNGTEILTQEMSPMLQGVYQYLDFIQYFGGLYKNSFINSPCNKLYITKIINEFNIRFIDNINMGEDLLFNLHYLNACNKISIINDVFYNYVRYNNNSLTRSFKRDLFENQQMLFREVRKFLLRKNCYTNENKYFVEASYVDNLIGCFDNLFHKNSDLTSKYRKKQIFYIVCDDCLRNNVEYLRKSSILNSFIGFLVRYKSINGIYCFFGMKNFLRYKLYPVFSMFKSLNN